MTIENEFGCHGSASRDSHRSGVSWVSVSVTHWYGGDTGATIFQGAYIGLNLAAGVHSARVLGSIGAARNGMLTASPIVRQAPRGTVGRQAVLPHRTIPAGDDTLGAFSTEWAMRNYPGRLGELLGRVGLKRPVPVNQVIDVQRGLPRSLLRDTLRHEKFHEWYANKFPQLAHLPSSRIPGVRGPAAYFEEIIAYGVEHGGRFRFRPGAAWGSLWGVEKAEVIAWGVGGTGGTIYVIYTLFDGDGAEDE